MSLRIILHAQHPVYTNLDVVSGTVILSLAREEAFAAITVKLECESKTRLATQRPDRRRADVEFELHKALYPTPQLQQATAGMRGATYVLPMGEHQFPFQFKFPFNNACSASGGMMIMGQDSGRHIKRTLPPSLTGFPGEASIQYFVKATAQRAGIFKENYREQIFLQFLPIEPPRQAPNKRESYARRQHQFSPGPIVANSGIFRQQAVPGGLPPRISIDGRLPDPAIITCNEAIPLRVLVKKLNETSEIIFLKSIHLVLVGWTKLTAHDLERVEQSTWVIASHANLQVALGNSNTPANKDIEIDNSIWANRPLPNTVAPTFETCNLRRWYELRVDVGLGWGSSGRYQNLRMPVEVFSGIKPPPELLAEMNQRPTMNLSQQSSNSIPQQAQYNPGPSSPAVISPVPLSSPQPAQMGMPQQTFTQHQPPHDPEGPIDDPPPSYEDAMAESLPPVNGRRGEYHQPGENQASDVRAQTEGERLFGGS